MPEKLCNMSFILSPSQSVPIISFTLFSDASIEEFSRRDKRSKTLLPFASVKQDEQHININAGVFMEDWKSYPSGGQVTFEFSPPTWKVTRRGEADGRPFLTLVVTKIAMPNPSLTVSTNWYLLSDWLAGNKHVGDTQGLGSLVKESIIIVSVVCYKLHFNETFYKWDCTV